MKIYKFKDLTDEKKHFHFYQIVLQNSVWCAKPGSLNDEDEFKFKLDYNPSPRTADLLSQVVARYRTCIIKFVLALVSFIFLIVGGLIGFLRGQPNAMHLTLLSLIWFPSLEFIPKLAAHRYAF